MTNALVYCGTELITGVKMVYSIGFSQHFGQNTKKYYEWSILTAKNTNRVLLIGYPVTKYHYDHLKVFV